MKHIRGQGSLRLANLPSIETIQTLQAQAFSQRNTIQYKHFTTTSKTRISLSAVPLPMRCTDSARGVKVFRGFCPAEGVALTRQEHTELCLTSGSHPGRGGPTTRAPAAQPATPPTLGTEATGSPLPATPPHLETEAPHSPWCSYTL